MRIGPGAGTGQSLVHSQALCASVTMYENTEFTERLFEDQDCFLIGPKKSIYIWESVSQNEGTVSQGILWSFSLYFICTL